MFQIYKKTYQTKYLAKTWQQALRSREITKNNYRVTGDMKKAKAFTRMVSQWNKFTHLRVGEISLT